MKTGKMTNQSRDKIFLLTDACVLIDFCKEDINLLGVASQHIGKIIIPSPILQKEVHQLTLEDCDRLGLIIYKPTESQLIKAAIHRKGLSEHDRLCLFIAIEEGYSLFTNDIKLLKAAKNEMVDAHWGLEILISLTKMNLISKKEATARAISICRRTLYPEDKIMAEFRRLLEE